MLMTTAPYQPAYVLARPVTPQQIVEQRARGWPDFHPETFCHRCGHPNVASWWVESEVWNAVMRGEVVTIVCPSCFTELAAERGVHAGTWRLSIDGSDHA